METIFHEKQEGSLCAQHCLNALLQGEYFTAVDLASLASQIDEEEREQMAEGGINSEDYQKFLEQPSGNMDDSGYFSVQVLARALKVWCLELIPYNSKYSVALMAQSDPTTQKAYICNYREHWFTIRKIGHQWFNLNSLLTGPHLISDTYLGMFLAQLREEGYSIFIVNGVLPDCTADQVLYKNPITHVPKTPQLLSDLKSPKSSSSTVVPVMREEEEECDLQAALQLSLQTKQHAEQLQLEEAMVRSLQDCSTQIAIAANNKDMPDESSDVRHKQPVAAKGGPSPSYNEMNGLTEEEMLEAALKMSLEAS